MDLEQRLRRGLRDQAEQLPVERPGTDRLIVRARQRRIAAVLVLVVAVAAGTWTAVAARGPHPIVVVGPDRDVTPSPPGADPSVDDGVAPAPVGSQVAFIETASAGELGEVDRIVVADTATGERRIVGRDRVYGTMSWSPDGRQMVYQGAHGLKIVRVADGNVRQVTDAANGGAADDGTDHDPVWSPDGRSIAFTRYPGGQLWVVQPDGSGLRQLTDPPEGISDLSATWSSDSRRLAVQRLDAEDASSLYVIDVTDGTATRIVGQDLDPVEPVWSPDGRWIAFFSPPAGGETGSVYVVRPDGTGLVRLAPAARSGIAWSPDGAGLAYVGPAAPDAGDRDDETDIRGLRLAEPEAHGLIADVRARDHTPSWSPTGLITFAAMVPPEGDSDVFSVAPDGSLVRPLTDSGTAHGPVFPPATVQSDHSGTTADVASVSASGVGDDVLELVDATGSQDPHVLVHHPDGSSTRIPVHAETLSDATVVPDDRGGFTWQASYTGGRSPAIVHVDHDGQTSVLLEAGSPTSERHRLVGGDSNVHVLVARTTGTTPDTTTTDLLQVPLDGGQHVVVNDDIAGWEATVQSAAYVDATIYAVSQEASSVLYVDLLDQPTTALFEGGQPAGERAVSVGLNGNGQAFALIADSDSVRPSARLLQIDPFDATVTDTVDIPLELASEGQPPWATDVSVEGPHVLVNRANDDGWLAPLVYDLDESTWSVLDLTGRALLAWPSRHEEPDVEDPPCAQHTDRRNAPPAHDTLDLYLLCVHSGTYTQEVYRLDADIEPTGQTAQDARRILQRLFEGPTIQRRDQGYAGLDPDTASGTIGIHEVQLDDGTLLVDFDFPSTGVGNYSTSTGMMVWHQLVLSNLMQFPEVDQVELRADGSCETYSSAFEGSGCGPYTHADAPWNRSS